MDELEVIDGQSSMSNPQGASKGGIPVFLKVLCILTFVGSGLGILGAFINMATKKMTERTFQSMNRFGSDLFDTVGFNLDEMMRWQTYMNVANLIGALLCLAGALMMWRLKKIGFYLYVPGAIIPAIVSAIGVQYMMSGFMSGLGTAGAVIGGLISVAFVIMYGLNFKHLK